MRCEPWMNKTPVPNWTPLQLAEKDVRHWSARLQEISRDRDEIEKQFKAALDRVEKLKLA